MKVKFLHFCVAIALWANITCANGQVNIQDSLALVDLYNSTNGPNWTYNTNWLTKNPVSTWYGITVAQKRVTVLDFYYNNLTGSIPSSIGNLINLSHLFFTGNQLIGSIPSSIG